MNLNKKLIPFAVGMLLTSTALQAGTTATASNVKQVLLISVDGLHQEDLTWYIQKNPSSNLATLVKEGTEFTNALTPFPSDSFPGMVGLATGGNPKTTGIYYDDGYSRSLLPFGTSASDCQSKKVTGGAETQYAENIDKLDAGLLLLDAGQGITGLYPITGYDPTLLANIPAQIYSLKSSPADVRSTLIDATQLPVDPTTCAPVYPHQFLRTGINTIFEVAKANGLHTAWSDKHPAYEILNGATGLGIDDFFAPEINSLISTDPTATDWTKDNVKTQQYDSIKVKAVLNQINGYDHSGATKSGVPAIFGLNFQAVSTAQKLNTSTFKFGNTNTAEGGYQPFTSGKKTTQIPNTVLQDALSYIDWSLGQFVTAINNNSTIKNNTAIIVTAKHGQSPIDRANLTIINDGDLTAALNAAWLAQYPKKAQPLVAHAMDDDGVLLWLNDRTTVATNFTKKFLMNYNSGEKINGTVVAAGIGSDAIGGQVSKAFKHAGLKTIYSGAEAAKFIGVKSTEDRVPDVIGIAQIGSVYGGSKLSKIAEHGGNAIYDRHVPIVVWAPGFVKQGVSVKAPVETVQVAPTILKLLGLKPSDLTAVKAEGTKVLPKI